MRAAILHGPEDLRIDEIDTPIAGDGDVVIKVGACGICGTDLSAVNLGSRHGKDPMPLGHEAAGVITEAGPAARGVSVGMRVAVNPMGEVTNVIGNGGTEGAFADYLLVRDAEAGRNLIPLPDGLPTHIAAIAEPLGVALHAVNRTGVQPGETAVVFGVGPIGLGAVIWLKDKGARHVVAVDLSKERLATAGHYGADVLVVPGQEDLGRLLAQEHGREAVLGEPCVGTDVYIDAAGAPGIVPQVIELAKLHARLVIPAVYRQPVSVDFARMLAKELTITTSIGYPDEFGDVVAKLAERPDFFERYISHRFPFERFHEAFDVAGARTAGKVMVEFEEA